MRNAARGPSRVLGPQVGNIRRRLPALPDGETEAVGAPLVRALGVVAAGPTARVPADTVRAAEGPAGQVGAALQAASARVARPEVAAKQALPARAVVGLPRVPRAHATLRLPSYRKRPKRYQHQ